MQEIEAYLDDTYQGFGLSQGLARGIQFRIEGENITQEGMGIGAIALKDSDCLVFARGITAQPLIRSIWPRNFPWIRFIHPVLPAQHPGCGMW